MKRREKEIECEIERLRDGKRVREREKKIDRESKMEMFIEEDNSSK